MVLLILHLKINIMILKIKKIKICNKEHKEVFINIIILNVQEGKGWAPDSRLFNKNLL